MIDIATEGLHIRFLPNESKDMELLDDHMLMGQVIPKGFIFDGASFIDENNAVRSAALLHDYCYRSKHHCYLNRKQVDEMFRDAMISLGVSKLKASTIYLGVRFGGKHIWKSDEKKRNNK